MIFFVMILLVLSFLSQGSSSVFSHFPSKHTLRKHGGHEGNEEGSHEGRDEEGHEEGESGKVSDCFANLTTCTSYNAAWRVLRGVL